MDMRSIRKTFKDKVFKNVGSAVDAFLAEVESAVSAAEDEARTATAHKVAGALGIEPSKKRGRPAKEGAKTAGTGKVGAPAGTQSCKIYPALDSKGPRYNYLSQQAHDLFYTGRTAEEAKALVKEVLAARARNEQHAMDPGLTPPVTIVAEPASAPVEAAVATVGEGADAVPEGASTPWVPVWDESPRGTPTL